MAKFKTLALVLMIVLLVGCGGGKTAPPVPVPDPVARVQIVGVAPARLLADGSFGYAGDETWLTATTSGEIPASIVWDFGGGAIPFGENPMESRQIELGPAGDYVGTITAIDSAGLSDTFDFSYRVAPESHRIQAITPAPVMGLMHEPVRLGVILDGEAEVITWHFLSGVDPPESQELSPIVRLLSSGPHEVDITVTFREGPTVTRRLPFTIAMRGWEMMRADSRRGVREMQTLSDGQVAVLMSDFADVRVWRILRLDPLHPEDQSLWADHICSIEDVGTAIDLEEQQGRIGILYNQVREEQQSTSMWMAISGGLHPTRKEHWSQRRVGDWSGAHSVGLAAKPGGGWSALWADGGCAWGDVGSTLPEPHEWSRGAYLEVDYPGTVELMQMGDVQVACAAEAHYVDVRVGNPIDIGSGLAGAHFRFPGLRGSFLESADRLALIMRRPEGYVVLVTPPSPPWSQSDFQTVATGITTTDTRLYGIDLTATELHVMQGKLATTEVGSFEVLEDVIRPLGDLSTISRTEEMTATGWLAPGLIPTSPAPIAFWYETNSGPLIWARHAEP